MSDEKKKEGFEYTCEATCFRDGTLYEPGDVMVTTKYKTAPKHFKGYDPKKDPDPKVDPNKKAHAKKAPAEKKAAAPKEGELKLDEPKE